MCCEQKNEIISICKKQHRGGRRKITIEEFIEKARIMHGDRYDYSFVSIISAKDKIKIICYIHGFFEQEYGKHLRGQGCDKCARENKKLTKEEFIKRSQEVHGVGTYGYDLVEIRGVDIRVKLICFKHGIFEQAPSNHVRGRGCPKCGFKKIAFSNRYTKEEFIKLSKKIHGEDTFDYSLVKYVNVKTKIKFICRIHGIFEQTPNNNLQGNGCFLCGRMSRSISVEDFIEKATAIHGNEKYDYSKIEHINSKTKLPIICKIHGEFKQGLFTHLSGSGCPTCGGLAIASKKRLTKNEFIEKANFVHGKNLYDYSKVEYKDSHIPVCIVCRVHGSFYQAPNSHLSGYGCRKCAVDKTRLSTEEFINRSMAVHGKDKYDYSKVVYHSGAEKVCIICHKHGYFYQLASEHLKGHGCCKCSSSFGEKAIIEWLTKNNIVYKRQHTYSDLRGLRGKNLRFDFYVPHRNLLIEFDGIQHFKPVCFSGIKMERAKEILKRCQINDSYKNKYCAENNIPILRIKYNEIKKIPEILTKYI